MPLFESGAILIYLADKTGQLMPRDAAARYQTIQWLMFQMGGIGPMFGQVGFFNKFAGKEYADKRPRDRYVDEAKRLLGVLNRQLAQRDWIMGRQYTIADVATFPWINNLIGFYEAGELVGIADFPHVTRALQSFHGTSGGDPRARLTETGRIARRPQPPRRRRRLIAPSSSLSSSMWSA